MVIMASIRQPAQRYTAADFPAFVFIQETLENLGLEIPGYDGANMNPFIVEAFNQALRLNHPHVFTHYTKVNGPLLTREVASRFGFDTMAHWSKIEAYSIPETLNPESAAYYRVMLYMADLAHNRIPKPLTFNQIMNSVYDHLGRPIVVNHYQFGLISHVAKAYEKAGKPVVRNHAEIGAALAKLWTVRKAQEVTELLTSVKDQDNLITLIGLMGDADYTLAEVEEQFTSVPQDWLETIFC